MRKEDIKRYREEECSKIHDLRKEIDALVHVCENKVVNAESDELVYSHAHEMGIATTKLQEAKMWMGKCLEKLGSELPKEYRDYHTDRK